MVHGLSSDSVAAGRQATRESGSFLADLTLALLEAQSLTDSARAVLEIACGALGADYGVLVYVTPDRDLLWMETWGLTWRKAEGELEISEDLDSSPSWLRHPAQRFVKRCRVLLHGQEIAERLPRIRSYVGADGKDRFVFHRLFENRFESYCALPLLQGGAVVGEITLGYAQDTEIPETTMRELRQAAPVLAAALARSDREADLRSVLLLLKDLNLISRRPVEEAPAHLSALLGRLASLLGAVGALLRIVEREEFSTAGRSATAQWVAGTGRYSDWARENLPSVPCDLAREPIRSLEEGESLCLPARAGAPPPTLDTPVDSRAVLADYWEQVESVLVLPLGKTSWTQNLLYLELHLEAGKALSARRGRVLEVLVEHMGLVLQLTHRLDEQGKRLKLLSNLSRDLLKARRFENYRDLIVRTLYEHLRAEISTVFLYNKKLCMLEHAACFPKLPGLEDLEEVYEPYGPRHGITGRVLVGKPTYVLLNDSERIAEEGIPANLEKYTSLPSWELGPKDGSSSPVRHILVVPIVGENGKAFGALRVVNKRSQDYAPGNPRLQEAGFTREDRELLETIAAAVASKLSSERRSERLETIGRAMAEIAAATSRERVAEVVVGTIVGDLGYSACSFRWLTPEGLILLCHQGFKTKTIQRVRVTSDQGLLGQAIAQRKVLFASDIQSTVPERHRGFENREFAFQENLRGACAVPILGDDQVYGAIVCYMRGQPYEFFDYETELLETLSVAASISFRRLAADERAQTARKRLERLVNILQFLLIAKTRDDVLSLIFDDLLELLAADAAAFYEARRSSHADVAEALWQPWPRLASDGLPGDFHLPADLLARTVSDGPQAFRTEAYDGTRELRRLYPYALAVSLRTETEVIGGILLLNRTDPALRIAAADRRRLSETVAEQLARAFEDIDLAEEKVRLERAVPAMISVRLASGMVHEIGTQADIGLNTLVPLRRTAERLTPAQKGQLGDAIVTFEKVGDLAREYLNFSRPVQRAVDVRTRYESINKIVRENLFSLRFETRRALLDTDLELALDRPHAYFDPKFLSLAIGNLVKNAMRWVPDGGRVAVSTASRGGGFVVRVEDWGPGVEAEVADKIFEAFFSRSKDGFGLGLTISRYIVEELHGGSLKLTNLRHPTVFEMSLDHQTRQETTR